jgi:signal transduction histidine kinase
MMMNESVCNEYDQNIVGLKLLTDDIQASMDPKDADRNDILSDANSACRTALDILNDLLCFDKLENGVLVLHKQEEPVLPFISDCVSMFSSQARECGVNLSIISPDLRNYTDSALKATDIAVMDKFKMDQVLRNLISNALKFTPRGGTVTVCAAFVPNEKQVPVPLRRHSEEDYMSYRSMKVYAVAEKQPDIEAAVPNSQELSSRSIKSYKSLKSKTKNNTINGKLVIVISDSGVGLSRVNLKRLFKEVLETSNLN